MIITKTLHIFSTNKEADTYNSLKFNNVKNPVHTFISEDKIHRKKKIIEIDKENPQKELSKFDLITLEMFDKYCKAPQILELKEGCKVMLLKNHNFAKGLINGSCGIVRKIEENAVLVKFDNGIEESITKNTFEYYREGELVSSRDQYPLRLAYGITIHKSQGMTLDELVVDCNRIFECGQAYVALSRIKTIDGLYLRSFNPNKVVVNEEVINFYDSLKNKI
ncbi:MAG: pif1, pif, PIF1 5'-to-3' DNA helicase-like protein, ATP-dependent DNA helicase PIF1 [Candidatus Peregrinibacteria bacterium GW2011_GWC2_33_13]|nr:MAG: pif1, pif, PIF1 5'-to-3' DNA helicase-like protein, ATP-dependent DNA helicase PIF1 [Candidatus Peregrinibacteria bacterium GW2011_GWC2_33_13]